MAADVSDRLHGVTFTIRGKCVSVLGRPAINSKILTVVLAECESASCVPAGFQTMPNIFGWLGIRRQAPETKSDVWCFMLECSSSSIISLCRSHTDLQLIDTQHAGSRMQDATHVGLRKSDCGRSRQQTNSLSVGLLHDIQPLLFA
jgi:hypothetical protein